MDLYIPPTMPYSEEEKDGKHPLNMGDMATLARVMKKFDSFEHLEAHLRRGNIEQRHALRNVDVLEWLDPDPGRWPKGGLRDAFVAVLNVFAEVYEKKGTLPTGLPFDYVLAKASEDLAITERSFKAKLNTLIKGKYIDLSYGNCLFPAVREKDAHPQS